MSLPSRLSSLVRNLVRARRVEADLDAEVRGYLDMLVDEKRRAGLPEDAARRAALLELQGVEQLKEHVREARTGALAEQLWQDLMYGVRVLAKHRRFTAAAVATLALGIGANTAIFSIVDGVVFRPLPYADPGRLVKIWGSAPGAQRTDISWPDFADLQSQGRSFESVAADDGTAFTVVHNGSRETVLGAMVTTEWLSTLGVRPILGRTFLPEEAQPGRDRVVIITHQYWRRRFASEPGVIGQGLLIDRQAYTVIGVLPLNVLRYGADFLKPLVPAEYPAERDHRDLDVFARLRPHVTIAEARTEMDTIAARLERQYPATNTGRRLTVVPLDKYYAALDPRAGNGLLLMFGAVAFVFLIACVNVVNLLLARGVARGREWVIRAALGASRARLIRQLLVENLLLFMAGGALGLLVARVSVDSLLGMAIASGYVPERMVVSIDARVFAFSLIVSVVSGVLVGLVPSLQASRVDVNVGLRDSGPTFSGGRQRARARRTLIVSELVLSLVLLVGFGLLVRSFLQVQKNARSLAADSVLETSAEGGRSFESAVSFWRAAMESARAVPGITAVAVTSRPPIHNARQREIAVAGRPPSSPGDEVGDILVSADYFRTMGVALVAGRAFTEHDGAASVPVVIISETLARRYFAQATPIGQRVRVLEDDPMTCCAAPGPVAGVWREVVGVVEDVRQANLDEPPAATLYRPYSQIVEHDMYLMARVASASQAPGIARDLRPRLTSAAPGTEWEDILPLSQVIDRSESIRLRRFVLILLGTFAGLALLLAAVGLYGVMAYFVEERRREIGIRLALGASGSVVLRQVMWEALRLALVALVVGVVAAHSLTRLIGTMLFGVTPTDPTTYIGVWLLLTAVALLATYVPARRAAHVDPIVALRQP